MSPWCFYNWASSLLSPSKLLLRSCTIKHCWLWFIFIISWWGYFRPWLLLGRWVLLLLLILILRLIAWGLWFPVVCTFYLIILLLSIKGLIYLICLNFFCILTEIWHFLLLSLFLNLVRWWLTNLKLSFPFVNKLLLFITINIFFLLLLSCRLLRLCSQSSFPKIVFKDHIIVSLWRIVLQLIMFAKKSK